jgi:death-on-curing family protein
MQIIEYPSRDILDWWVKYLEDEANQSSLKKYLPVIDKGWIDNIAQIIELIQNDYYQPQELHYKAALIFYKIIKNHSYIDSNKRSSIIAVYLFYIINNYVLLNTDGVRLLAIKVAKSKGRRNQPSWLKKISIFFEKNTALIDVSK